MTALVEAPARAWTTTSAGRIRWTLAAAPPLPGGPSELLRGKRVRVLNGTPETAGAVAAELVGAGAVVVDGGVVDALVDLTLPPGAADYRAALGRTVAAVRAVYEDWAAESSATRIGYVAVTYLGGTMGYREDVRPDQPLGGVWAGFAKTLHREIPNCNARVLDVADVAALPGLLVRELYRWGLFEVGHRDGRRTTLAARHEPVGSNAVRLGPDDTVLVSGGGRGIGFRLARTLAEEFDCRVVVTGRQQLPTGSPPWAGLSEAEFKRYRNGLLVRRSEPLAAVRRTIEGITRSRELLANLADARAAGLRISYEHCDFTDRARVAGLVADLGRVTGVVHNAGVDHPVRLPRKSDADFAGTVETKVDGFRSLFDAVRHLPLKFFCNVGSLTGRLGGMVGQLDYAAANDGLARLGLWARGEVAFPVSTLCWPTWERLGMVANFEATLRYMAPLGVEDGVRRWVAELLAGTSGEVTFVLPLGPALTPVQAAGYPASTDVPGFADVLPRVGHLGTLVASRPHEWQTADVLFDRTCAPVLAEFAVDGVEAVPVSVLLENAARAAEWVTPEDLPRLVLDRVDDLVVHPAGLALRDGRTTLRRTLTGRHEGDEWVVLAEYATASGDPVASARLAHRVVGRPHRVAALPPAGVLPEPTGGHLLCWRGRVLPVARDGVVGAVLPEDLWVLPQAPRSLLPHAALENALRLAFGHHVDRLAVRRIALHDRGAAHGPCRIDADPASGRLRVSREPSGTPVLDVHPLRRGDPT
ncbi:KR domain-containing protein [Actinosynnema sp. NPDC020468]|uniref:KR domain-containing protein n=1 Tax=Actinosynnema sp. NPDC020468 TaxID=3154488 RepID=UPI0033F75BB1